MAGVLGLGGGVQQSETLTEIILAQMSGNHEKNIRRVPVEELENVSLMETWGVEKGSSHFMDSSSGWSGGGRTRKGEFLSTESE